MILTKKKTRITKFSGDKTLNKVIKRRNSNYNKIIKAMWNGAANSTRKNLRKATAKSDTDRQSKIPYKHAPEDFQSATLRLAANNSLQNKPLILFTGGVDNAETTAAAVVVSRKRVNADSIKISDKTLYSEEKKPQYGNDVIRSDKDNEAEGFIETAAQLNLPGTRPTTIDAIKDNLNRETAVLQKLIRENPAIGNQIVDKIATEKGFWIKEIVISLIKKKWTS